MGNEGSFKIHNSKSQIRIQIKKGYTQRDLRYSTDVGRMHPSMCPREGRRANQAVSSRCIYAKYVKHVSQWQDILPFSTDGVEMLEFNDNVYDLFIEYLELKLTMRTIRTIRIRKIRFE